MRVKTLEAASAQEAAVRTTRPIMTTAWADIRMQGRYEISEDGDELVELV